ncbi:MAG: RNA 2',3'-cyclic phosphodiesterase, partial [Hydrogenovibrio sp.]
MRLFFAIPVDAACTEQLKMRLAPFQARPEMGAMKWTPPLNWHLTLSFLGEVGEGELEAIRQSMSDWFAEGMSYFEAELLTLGGFPNPKTGSFWVAKLDATLMLQSLVREIDDHLRPLGFAKRKHAFRPHITLGKWKGASDDFPTIDEPLEPIQLRVDRLNLYQ